MPTEVAPPTPSSAARSRPPAQPLHGFGGHLLPRDYFTAADGGPVAPTFRCPGPPQSSSVRDGSGRRQAYPAAKWK
ncbi:MAG: hypothetical protein JWN52_2262 [Actinomycetia bacterium]|nr:hypothetical protein [Actinomycetes bacterium]